MRTVEVTVVRLGRRTYDRALAWLADCWAGDLAKWPHNRNPTNASPERIGAWYVEHDFGRTNVVETREVA